MITPLLNKEYTCRADLDEEISFVSEKLSQIALFTLPSCQPKKRKKHFVNNKELQERSIYVKMAWKRWRNAGRPRSGPLFNEKNASKREVTKFANKCRARMDRKQWQNHENKFKDRDNSRFRVQKTKSVIGNKLFLDGVPTTDPSKIMQSWLNHFSNLFKSEAHSIQGISAIQDQIPLLTNQSMLNCDGVLDDPFSGEEIEHAVRRLKSGKASGIDGLVPENSICVTQVNLQCLYRV